MKKLLLLVCAFFVAQGLSAQVWVPLVSDLVNLESFRHQATQSIEDDLDNGIDGTDIFKVKGARIYTNLSNLVTSTESPDSSANTVVIGATSPIYKGWKLTAFYANANSNNSFDGNIDETNYEDTDFDEDFDEMYFQHMDSTAKDEESTNSILVNLGKQMGKGTELAFTYKRMNYNNTEEMEDSAYYISRTLVPTVSVDEFWYGSETYLGGRTSPVTTYALSYSKPYRNWTARGDLFFISGGENFNSEETGSYFEDRDPGDASTVFTTNDTINIIDNHEYTANLVGIGLRISDLNKNTGLLWEVGGNYGMAFGSGNADYVDREHLITQDELIPSQIQIFDSLYADSMIAPISVSGNVMGLNGRIEWQIAENVKFGLGFLANSFSLSQEQDRTSKSDIIVYANDDDGIPDMDDYTLTVSGTGREETYTLETKENRIAIPAGIELNFGKNKDWYLRLGAIGVGSKTEFTEKMVTDTVYLSESEIVYGTGSSSTTLGTTTTDTDYDVSESFTEQDVYYSYGLGWKPSPNLSLDLIGMFDATNVELLSTDWLRSLKLSATINIY